jgi:pentatricopeptide repeat protein
MDASLLLLPLVGFLPARDKRIRCTVAEIEKRLLHKGLVLRYETETGVDGLPPGEGAFLACSFWLVEALALAGRVDEARTLFDDVVRRGNDAGLFSEEIDVHSGEMLGNFPQALTHIALMTAALCLAQAEEGKAEPRAT